MTGAQAARRPGAAGLYLAHLMVRALQQRTADAPPAGVTWQQVHGLAAFHSLEGLTWCAVRGRGDVEEGLAAEWEAQAEHTLWRRLQFDVEREQVLAALAAAGFSYLPLKGILLADCYPEPCMRSMADNDILYGRIEPAPGGGWRVRGETEKQREQETWQATHDVAAVMKQLGYTPKSLYAGAHDTFFKAPCLNFELHRKLAHEHQDPGGYYANPWKRAVPDGPQAPFAYHFTPEDDYVYRTSHTYKHFIGGGCGLRHLADEQVFLASCGQQLDWAYIEGELATLGLGEFERSLRALTEELFAGEGLPASGEGLSEEGAALLGYLLGSGTYGTTQQHVENAVAQAGGSGVRYVLQRFVPPRAKLADGYPCVARWPATYPFVVVWRWCKALAHAPKTLAELRSARAASSADGRGAAGGGQLG